MRKEEVLITVEMAQEWLQDNIHNRALNQAMVNDIAADMINAEFDYENTHVVLDKNGKFFYGQHILNAIIQNNEPCTVEVITIELGDKFQTMHKGYYNKKSKYKYGGNNWPFNHFVEPVVEEPEQQEPEGGEPEGEEPDGK